MASKLSSFLAELRRRKVYRVAGVYVAVGLGTLGAAEVILDPLGLGDLRGPIVILVLLGFPIALVLAWAYERTPEGIVRTGDAAPGELTEIAAAPATKRWPIGLAGVAGGALLATSAFWVLWGTRGDTGDRDMESAAPAVAALGQTSASSRQACTMTS